MFLVYICLYVFFFKQKTAYEMRISDWSSDVCSSDLGDIDDDAGDHRADDADLEIAVGVLRLLGRGRNRVEAIEGEEDDCRRRHHPVLDAVGAHMLVKPIGTERFEISRVKRGKRDLDKDAQRAHLDNTTNRAQR